MVRVGSLVLSTFLLFGCVGKGVRHSEMGLDMRAGEVRASEARVDAVPPVESKWIPIQPGSFRMGSPLDEPCRQVGETEHQVTLTRKFELLSTEVTQAKFAELMSYVPFSSCGANCPVAEVTWNEAAAFANALSKKAGLATCYACSGTGSAVRCEVDTAYRALPKTIYNCPGYRLPTDAEWEYAYRAGTTTAFYGGAKASACSGPDANADSIGWYKANAGGDLHRAGLKRANAWALHDMAGNAAEWVNDYCLEDLGTAPATDPVGPATGTQRVIRGGSFDTEALALRAAARSSDLPTTSYSDYGFRVARTLAP